MENYRLFPFFRVIVMISLLFAQSTAFAQSHTQTKKVKEYLLHPVHERYNNDYWVEVSQTTFYHLHSVADKPEIITDTSAVDIPEPHGFRIFLDKAGNPYYWIHPMTAPDTIPRFFSKEEQEAEEMINAFSAEFIVKYPYAEDTAMKGTPKYAAWKLNEDTLSKKTGYQYTRDDQGNLFDRYGITNSGFTHIDMLLKSATTGKQVLIKGESIKYGRLCVLLRFLMESDNQREALIIFLTRNGRSASLTKGSGNFQFISRYFMEIMPDALAKLAAFHPFPFERTDLERDVEMQAEKRITFNSATK